MSQTTNRHRFSILALRLALIIAILVATGAFMPAPAKAATEGTAKPTLTAKIQNTKILWVSGSNFIASRSYILTANGNNGKVRLGKVQASKAGKIDVKYKMSSKLQLAKTIRVCAQDASNGKNYCVTVKKK